MLKKRFFIEFIVGISTLTLCYFIGTKGMSLLSLIVLMPLIGRKQKFDERDYQILYKTGNFSIVSFFLSAYFLENTTILKSLSINFSSFMVLIFLIFNGILGLYFSSRG